MGKNIGSNPFGHGHPGCMRRALQSLKYPPPNWCLIKKRCINKKNVDKKDDDDDDDAEAENVRDDAQASTAHDSSKNAKDEVANSKVEFEDKKKKSGSITKYSVKRYINKKNGGKKDDAAEAANPGDDAQASTAHDSKNRKGELANSKDEDKKRKPSSTSKYSVRRYLHKKNGGKKDDAETENPGDDAQASTARDSSKNTNDEVANSKVEDKKRKSSSTTKCSVSKLKALITEEVSKRKIRGKHKRSKTCPAKSQLEETQIEAHIDDPLSGMAITDGSPKEAEERNGNYSDGNLEDQVLPKSSEESTTSDENDENHSENQLIDNATFPQEDLNDKELTFLKHKSLSSKEVVKDGSADQSECSMDMMSLNKGFLLKLLQDPRSPLAHHFQNRKASSTKMGISKYGSFPSRIGCVHDHESTEDICRKSMPLIAADHREDGVHQLDQAKAEIPDISSPFSPNHVKQYGGNETAKLRFKGLKQRIKYAIKESKKEGHRIAMDAVLHKVPHDKGFSKDLNKDITKIEDVLSQSSTKQRRSRYAERPSSFSESMDRYAKLYESSFNREAKQHISQRVQEISKEDVVLPRRKPLKSLGRIVSSPELHSDYVYQIEGSSDAFSSNVPIASADCTLSLCSFKEPKTQHVSADLGSDTLGRSKSEVNLSGLKETVSVSSETSKSQEADLEEKQFHRLPYEQDLSPDDQQHEYNGTSKFIDQEKFEFEKLEAFDSYFLEHDIDMDTNDIDKFTYIRDVLELSGFSGTEALGTWHADDQPLDPLMYEEIKGCIFCHPDCSGDEEGINYCQHPLLFDLINEVLVEVYERSYSYCDRPLSSLCHIRPEPVGQYVLKEVWENISWYLSYATGTEKPLDYVASRDLTRSDGWMNLQFETECLGFELEDSIFDDLLEEILI